MSDVDRLEFLVDEIHILEGKIREHDTGHIHTAINVLKQRVKEVKEKLKNES
jgi:predicted metal-dependent hydrolase